MHYKHSFSSSRTWERYFLAGVLAFLFSSCSTLKSDLTVSPGGRFELGGNSNGAFTVALKNTGDVPVTISERKANGQNVALGIFNPGEEQTVRFSNGSAALISNASARPARLFLTVSGDKNLGMSEQVDQKKTP